MNELRLGRTGAAILAALRASPEPLYGVPLSRALARRGRDVSSGAMYVTLDRLERRGLVSGRWGEATPERSWRRRRYYAATYAGLRVLADHERRQTERAALPWWRRWLSLTGVKRDGAAPDTLP